VRACVRALVRIKTTRFNVASRRTFDNILGDVVVTISQA